MAQYIPKSSLVEEIENLVDKGKHHDYYQCAFRDGNNSALYALKGKLDTLEVKEVDLEKEMSEYFVEHSDEFFSDKYKLFAKHFFELGMAVSNKAQKGE